MTFEEAEDKIKKELKESTMKRTILRIKFWYKKAIVADYTAYKLRWYNARSVTYSEPERPYTICPYAVLVAFTNENIADFEDIVKASMDTAEVAEIMIGNSPLKLVK